ncbi:MAG: hypothetical protein JW994_05415 [Candidatus Omnitrophica bacterium]|nr:hypothetical protein [Candidatus Omnitrophota bacterium]
METSIFIARIFGLCYLVIGTAFAFNRKTFRRIMDDFCKNAALVFLSGMFALVIGIVIILKHNIWTTDWTVIITVIGWCGLVKGIWIITFPETVPRFMQAYQKNENLSLIHSVAALALGVILTYFGFFCRAID